MICADLMNNLMQLWDLRNVMTPTKEFVGHSRGIGTCIVILPLFICFELLLDLGCPIGLPPSLHAHFLCLYCEAMHSICHHLLDIADVLMLPES